MKRTQPSRSHSRAAEGRNLSVPSRGSDRQASLRPLRMGPLMFIGQTQPGFESIAWSEIETRAAGAREHARRIVGDRAGMTIFSGPKPEALRELRCCEDILALTGYRFGIGPEMEALDRVRATAREAPFIDDALAARVHFQKGVRAGRRLRFRVVARQVGEHEYRRIDLQRAVERGIEERGDHTWRLDEDRPDVEFWATQLEGELFIALRLSDEHMRHRDYKIAHRAGSLRASVAAAIAWMSQPSDGDIVLDPFCGAGTVLIERAHLGRYRNLIGSDSDPAAIRAARENIGTRYKPIELHEGWDAGALPLADGSVTKIITNLPWGMKHGSHRENRRLYGDWIAEMNRVLAHNGKMVLLTSEWRLMRELAERGELRVQASRRVTVLGAPTSIYDCVKSEKAP